METVQRMRGSTSSTSNHKRRGSRRSTDGMETTLRAINLSANVPAQSLPLIMNTTYHKSNKLILPRKTQSAKSKSQKLWFESPRLELEDDQVFPESGNVFSDPQERWNAVKEQAGKHQQDGSVLILRPHIHSPQVLKSGMPPQAASRVKELHVQVTSETMPAWMDAIVNTFFNLQHLHITQVKPENRENEVRQSVRKTRVGKATSNITSSSSNTSEEDEEEARLAAEHSDKLKRLYILYRLPDLISIDGMRVTSAERSLANPDDPNGQRVDKKEWVHNHERRADLRISLPEGEESVEVDVLIGTPCARPSSLIAPSGSGESGKPNSFSSISAEDSRVGSTNRSTATYEEEEKKEELSCHDEPTSDNTSIVTTDYCQWSATCGTLALWSTPPEKKTGGENRVIRKSNTWKECRKLVSVMTSDSRTKIRGAERSMRLIPTLEPVSAKKMYRSSSRSSKTTSTMPGTAPAATSSRRHGSSPSDHKRRVSRVPTEAKSERKSKSSSSSLVTKSSVSEERNQPEPKKKSSIKSLLDGSDQTTLCDSTKTISAPFPRTKPASPTHSTSAEAGVAISSLEIRTSQEDEDFLIPPPPPSSSRAGALMETIDFRPSPTHSANCTKPKVTATANELPPPCPGAPTSAAKTKVTTPRQRRRKKRQDRLSKWRVQQTARRTSIIDDDDEEEESGDESSYSESDDEDDDGPTRQEVVEIEAISSE
mmetsp:Transcript_14153/g.30874  ORF Transcript_14153/g.30874 Transcript_14153/m.30874 type:complete len:712 (-) Transcript_14153:59-2194(-)